MNRKSVGCKSPKETTVTFWNQYARSFVTPYGPASPAPEPNQIYPCLKPFTCEWLTRPKVALSEFAHTIESNLKILENAPKSGIKTKSLIKKLNEHFSPIMASLTAVNNKSESQASLSDVKQVCRAIVSENEDLDDAMDQMFAISNALFSISCNYIVSRSLLCHPDQYAQLIEVRDETRRAFKANPTVKNMKAYLFKGFHKTTHTAVSRNALKCVQEGFESSDEETSGTSSSSSSSTPSTEVISPRKKTSKRKVTANSPETHSKCGRKKSKLSQKMNQQQSEEEQKQEQPNEQNINLALLQQFDADEPQELVVNKSAKKQKVRHGKKSHTTIS